MRLHVHCLLISALFAISTLVVVRPSSGYERWADGCPDCHNDFTDSTSAKPGNTWPQSKHTVHRSNMMTFSPPSSCGACHVNSGDNPRLNSSAGYGSLPPVSCMGCHGADPTPGTANNHWGAGLRLHHANANVGPDNANRECVDCHENDPLPMPEDVLPAYYGGANIHVLDPCNLDGSENWTSDGFGLDNDGDLDYDSADSNCPLFADGFESGDASNWSTTVP